MTAWTQTGWLFFFVAAEAARAASTPPPQDDVRYWFANRPVMAVAAVCTVHGRGQSRLKGEMESRGWRTTRLGDITGHEVPIGDHGAWKDVVLDWLKTSGAPDSERRHFDLSVPETAVPQELLTRLEGLNRELDVLEGASARAPVVTEFARAYRDTLGRLPSMMRASARSFLVVVGNGPEDRYGLQCGFQHQARRAVTRAESQAASKAMTPTLLPSGMWNMPPPPSPCLFPEERILVRLKVEDPLKAADQVRRQMVLAQGIEEEPTCGTKAWPHELVGSSGQPLPHSQHWAPARIGERLVARLKGIGTVTRLQQIVAPNRQPSWTCRSRDDPASVAACQTEQSEKWHANRAMAGLLRNETGFGSDPWLRGPATDMRRELRENEEAFRELPLISSLIRTVLGHFSPRLDALERRSGMALFVVALESSSGRASASERQGLAGGPRPAQTPGPQNPDTPHPWAVFPTSQNTERRETIDENIRNAMQSLDSGTLVEKIRAARTLGALRGNAKAAVPSLLTAAKGTDSSLRVASLAAIESIGLEAPTDIPFLISVYQSDGRREAALSALRLLAAMPPSPATLSFMASLSRATDVHPIIERPLRAGQAMSVPVILPLLRTGDHRDLDLARRVLSALEPTSAGAIPGLIAALDSGPGRVGLSLAMHTSPPPITAVEPGSPAWQAGLRVGDVLLSIDGMKTYGMPGHEYTPRLRGNPGSVVRLEVRGAAGTPVRMLDLARREMPDPGVRATLLSVLAMFGKAGSAEARKAVSRFVDDPDPNLSAIARRAQDDFDRN